MKQLPQDEETKKLQTSINKIRMGFVDLLTQAEQGQSTLEQAREKQELRKQEIRAHKQCLEETESWMRHVSLSIDDQSSILNYQV